MFTCSFSTSTFRYLLSLPLNFAFSSSSMCVLSPLGAFFFHTVSSRLVAQRWVLRSCFSPALILSPWLQSTPLGYLTELQTPFCAPQVTGGSVCLENQTQNRDCKGISACPSNNSSEKKLAYLYFHFLQPDILTYPVAKAQKLQRKLVLSCFLPFSLRCCPLTSIVQAFFSFSWGVLLKK